MALTKNGIYALIAGNIPDNSAGEVSPSDVREVATQNADSALNVLETATQTVVGNTNFTGGLKKVGLPVLTGVREVDILRASSTAANQQPTVLGTPLQVEYGAAQAGTYVSLAANGALTCNVTGYYPTRLKLQAGRSGASGTSVLMIRILINGVQFGSSQVSKLTSADQIDSTDSKLLLFLNAGDVLTTQIIRDSAGTNFGGLFAQTSSHGWNLATSALMVVSRVEGIS
jgi:hypothetical protein